MGILGGLPASEAELRRRVPVGTRIDVLYNADAPRATIENESARVRPYEDDFPAAARRRLWQSVRRAYLPSLVSLPLAAAWTWLFRRWWRARAAAAGSESDASGLVAPGAGVVYLVIAVAFLLFALAADALILLLS